MFEYIGLNNLPIPCCLLFSIFTLLTTHFPSKIGKWERVQVTVKTSDMDDAGTHAQVYITAFGSKGHSDKLLLSSPESNVFDKGVESEINVSYIC